MGLLEGLLGTAPPHVSDKEFKETLMSMSDRLTHEQHRRAELDAVPHLKENGKDVGMDERELKQYKAALSQSQEFENARHLVEELARRLYFKIHKKKEELERESRRSAKSSAKEKPMPADE